MFKCIEQLKEETKRLFKNQTPTLKVQYGYDRNSIVYKIASNLHITISRDVKEIFVVYKDVRQLIDKLNSETKKRLEKVKFKEATPLKVPKRKLGAEFHRQLIAIAHQEYLKAEESYPKFKRILYSTIGDLSPLIIERTGKVIIDYDTIENVRLYRLLKEII